MKMFENDCIRPEIKDAELLYFPNFFNEEEAWQYYDTLMRETPWIQDDIKVFGKTYKQPRLTAFYADNLKTYSYSGIIMEPLPYTRTLMEIKSAVENWVEHNFSSCLLNLYRNGQDSNGWHADNEKELGTNPVIASVSLGASRLFKMKHRKEKDNRLDIALDHGSLLLMKGRTQHCWLHQIPKTRKAVEPRINLTFRYIK